jgi:dihydrodipicolinate synthase/N-acetylneuraminate lyase
VAELSAHENVVGVKDSRGSLDLVAELVKDCRPGFQVLVGNGAVVYASLELGAVGGILAVANLDPGRSVGIVESFSAGRSAEAGRLQEMVGPVHKAVVGGLGVAGVKAGTDLLGLRGGDPRPQGGAPRPREGPPPRAPRRAMSPIDSRQLSLTFPSRMQRPEPFPWGKGFFHGPGPRIPPLDRTAPDGNRRAGHS